MMNYSKRKAIVLAIVLVAGMLLPVGALAQDDVVRRGGLFSYYGWFNSEEEEIRGLLLYNEEGGRYALFNQQFGSDNNGGYELFNQTFGQNNEEVPLGSGLLILVAAGAGYALIKRKNNKK